MVRENDPVNYYLLSRNIELNRFDDKISAFCLAFDQTTRLDTFYMADTKPGSALNSFGSPTDWKGDAFDPVFRQAMLGFSVDDFIQRFDLPVPAHIKIDVDGIEHRILNGASSTLEDPRLKSVLIELDTDNEKKRTEVVEQMKKKGFTLQVDTRASQLEAGLFAELHNHIFYRSGG